MKKLLIISLVLVSTLNVVFGQYTDTQIANSIRKSLKYNPGVSDPDSIYPNQTLWFVVPVDAVTGDSEWVIIEKIGNAISGDRRGTEDFKPDPKPEPVVKPVPIVQPEVKNYDYLWWAIIILCIFLGLAIYFLLKALSQKRNIKEHDDRMLKERNVASAKLAETERELQATKNKLPIVPPAEGVDEEWLANNYQEGESIVGAESEKVSENFNRAYGVSPDFVIKAKVSTIGDGVTLGYSHGRTAVTKFKNVTVFIGWNWKDGAWIEVGLIAGPCANRFVSNPEQVQGINELFTSFVLADGDNPVVFRNNNIPNNEVYPTLARRLVISYQEMIGSVDELRRAGAIVKTK